ncbi:protein BatD [candidate division KSB1 bacterium]|nr:protein BatD [candidate division KSB1 bacterium]
MKQMVINGFYIVFFIMVAAYRPLMAADITITAKVDRTVVAENQTFTYTIELSGDKVNSLNGDPELPDVSGFATFLGSSGTSQNVQITMGKMSVTKSQSYTYMANKVGTFEIGPATVEYRGKQYKTDPIPIEVVKQNSTSQSRQSNRRGRTQSQSQSQNNASIEDNLFLKTAISKRTVYVNEPVILTYKIYTNVTVTSYGVAKEPNTIGFWVEDFPMRQQPQTKREMYEGREFVVADIKKMALFPTEAGEKEISPMQIECDVRVQNRSSRSMFDSFFDDPFFGRSVRYSVFSPPVKLNVLPLPAEGKPRDFSGAVGSFNVTATIDKNEVHTNEALALKVTIAGTGNIKIIPEPVIQFPEGFERYDPKVTENIDRNGNRISGSKTYEYVLIPRYTGKKNIPSIEFSYFNPANGSYQRARTGPIVIDVTKGKDEFAVSGTGLSKEEVQLIGKDIRYIQTHAPAFRKIGNYFYNSFLFAVLAIVPILGVGVAVGQRHHLDKLNGNVAYARSRRANQMAMNRLKKAKKALSESTQKEFYAEVANALMGFLADKLNIEAAGIITDEVEGMMTSKKIEVNVIEQYMNCLKTCDFQRFAPANSGLDEMKSFYEQAKDAIIALEKVI